MAREHTIQERHKHINCRILTVCFVVARGSPILASATVAMPRRSPRTRGAVKTGFEDLPEALQSRIYREATTPSCPAPVRLALVSRRWGAAAEGFLRQEGVSIELQLACDAYSNAEQLQQEQERLESLAAWIEKRGQVLTGLSILPTKSLLSTPEAASQRGWGMRAVIDALERHYPPEGPQLQQLQLPAIGIARPEALSYALKQCHQLRHLSLDAGDPLILTKDWPRYLSQALPQLTQLTSLTLDCGLFGWPREYDEEAGCWLFGNHAWTQDFGSDDEEARGRDWWDGMNMGVDLDCFWTFLPSSLAVLNLVKNDQTTGEAMLCLDTGSLARLTALQRLSLPDDILITSNGGRRSSSSSRGGSHPCEGNPLAALTALTYLNCGAALHQEGQELLDLPNLAELWAGIDAGVAQLVALSSLKTLRTLGCAVDL
jgi:hypothetical protein